MAMPEVPPDYQERLAEVEDAVQRFQFVHMVKVEATTAGLAILYAQQQRTQQELSGFRAETAAHLGSVDTRLGSVDTRLDSIEAEQARQGEMLAEVLRRLPEQ
jgi:ABC-type phosphate transport system auxiliary subunit